MTPSSARGPTASCACGTVRSSRRRGAGRMALPEASAWAIVIGVVLVAVVIGFRPLLARLAARNIGRRKSRVVIVVAGLLVGTAIISSSLVVGDTLSYIFLEDVYARLDAIDELVSNSFNGQLFSFAETNFTEIAGDLAANATPIDGIAPALLKVMPVRNVAGNKGNQQITVMGLDASREGGFGPLTLVDGRTVDTDRLSPAELYANERASADLNATAGQDLTLFYGTTNQTIVHATVAGIVRNAGKAAYESRAILFMDLRRAQAAFNESGAINLIRVSNRGGIADSVAYSDRVTQDLRLSIATRHLLLRVEAVKADDTAQAVQIGRDATDLFLVMGAFGILAGVLLIVNIFVMLAEERKPELGVARAVGFLRSDLPTAFPLEGEFYAVVAAALGALAGLGLGYVMVYFFDKLVPHGDVVVAFHFDPTSVVTAFVAGTSLTWITILVASWRVSRLDNVRPLRGPPEPRAKERSPEGLIAGGPILKPEVSSPMDRRFRTGMTVAMFALILFMVTLISMPQGLQASSLESFVQQQSGGYDVIAYTTTYSEIPNFRESLRANFSEALFAGGYNGTSSASVMPARVEAIGGERACDQTPPGRGQPP